MNIIELTYTYIEQESNLTPIQTAIVKQYNRRYSLLALSMARS